MIHTEICDLFGIEYPIFQGGMAWVADASLAAAVSNGGGLGLIAGMNSNAAQLREQIDGARKLTNRPFGVNVMLKSPFADEVAAVVAEEKIPVVTTGAGDPSKYMEKWLAAGVRVVPVVPSVATAIRVVRRGACAVVAEGSESGGHIGELTTMALVPQVCDAVDVPVLAAGGIADGRGIAAAFMLGARGVQVGTRFLVAQECTIHQNYKDHVLRAKDIDTIVTGRRLHDAVRALKTPFTREFMRLETDSAVPDGELAAFGTGALRRAAREGDEQKGCFIAGQCAGLVTRAQPAAEIIREMFAQAEKLLGGAAEWVK